MNTQTKTNLIDLFTGLLLAPVAPLAGFMAGWWLAYALLPEKWIPVGAVAGLVAGFLADIFLWVKKGRRVLDLSPGLWILLFLLYSIGIFGMFMGVPVVNLGLALPAGILAAARLGTPTDKAQLRIRARKTALFTTAVLGLICIASAWLALRDPYTAGNLEGMLGLPFSVTPGMILALILVGGVGLLAMNWIVTVLAARLTGRFLSVN